MQIVYAADLSIWLAVLNDHPKYGRYSAFGTMMPFQGLKGMRGAIESFLACRLNPAGALILLSKTTGKDSLIH
ncbi:hypothetical protein [Rhizobium ruizarguesonis]|uniref:hypothetical protein n=1 Tax=Rhizobium ruizarguesonis TaxID=2081791 RepID=UPI0010318EE2|nr:hypothetical protein [Rhizobium ruizarguesonis]TBA06364.1 hypothetical protein ELH64_18845 [Rhizobium ruizarguesonis]